MLTWAGEVGNINAIGNRGTYSITSTGLGLHVLQGIGHDELPMLDLPPFGAVFPYLDHAKDAAGRIDSHGLVEPQMSGG